MDYFQLISLSLHKNVYSYGKKIYIVLVETLVFASESSFKDQPSKCRIILFLFFSNNDSRTHFIKLIHSLWHDGKWLMNLLNLKCFLIIILNAS